MMFCKDRNKLSLERIETSVPCDCFVRTREAVILPAGPAYVILAHDDSKSEMNPVRTDGDALQSLTYMVQLWKPA